ncbi:MAG: LPS-assembly protein LptD [Desulfosoma sp.]|uniref:LPS-assembly protein LptD n=1 Tax=Desulfosoma sp. TaxID=2603217 RepID=UPI00404932E4
MGIGRFLIRLSFLTAAFLMASVSPARLETQTVSQKPLQTRNFFARSEAPWTIEAQTLRYDAMQRIYQAEGDVHITSDNKSIRADWAQVDLEKQEAQLAGSVRIQYGSDWLTGNKVIWHLDTETGWVDGGTVYFSENGFYLSGKTITKRGPDRYHVSRGTLTSCDPAAPDWSIAFADLDVTVDGLGWAKHGSFRLGKLPVFYMPFAFFPVNKERQSGFLLPTLGSSNLHGPYLEIPLYWAWRQDMDWTFYANTMKKRGVMLGAEYRMDHATLGEGVWFVNYLADQADPEDLKAHGYPFQERDRYWLRARHTVELPHQAEMFLDLDLVSDQNFLKEFQSGSVSRTATNRAFRRVSQREILNDETITSRESSLYVLRRWESAVASMDVRYWNQLDRKLDETTLQQLPYLRASVTPSALGLGSTYYSLDASAVHYWRPQGDAGLRTDIFPTLAYPIHWFPYLAVEPSLGLRSTLYQADTSGKEEAAFTSRWVPEARLTASTRMERVYRPSDTLAVQHVIRPDLLYVFIPDIDQEDLPFFDDLDRIGRQDTVLYGFSSFLTTKKTQSPPGQDPQSFYKEWARLAVHQAYLVGEPVPKPPIETQPGKRFSDILMSLDLTPERYLNLSYDVTYSPYQGRANIHDLSFWLNSHRGDWAQVTYRYRQDTAVDEIIGSAHLQVRPPLSLYVLYDYSFDKEETFKQVYGLQYRHGCWGLRMSYREEAKEKEVSLALVLVGLGQIGGTLAQDGDLSLNSNP